MMNVNEEMMFGVLLVLMFGPDTGPPAAAPSTGYGPALNSCSRPVCLLEDFASGSSSVPTDAGGHLQA